MIKSIPQNQDYGVDENGVPYSIRYSKKLKGSVNSGGYLQLYTYNDAKPKAYLVHRLVWNAFVGEIPAGFELDHIDRDRTNNSLSNLRLVTRQQNRFNSAAKGCTYNKISKSWMAYIITGAIRKHLGYFKTEAEAHTAYLAAKEVYHVI